MVAQVDEQQAPMIADAMHPAGETNGLADVAFTQFAAGMRAIAMHGVVSKRLGGWERRKVHGTPALSRKRGGCALASGDEGNLGTADAFEREAVGFSGLGKAGGDQAARHDDVACPQPL